MSCAVTGAMLTVPKATSRLMWITNEDGFRRQINQSNNVGRYGKERGRTGDKKVRKKKQILTSRRRQNTCELTDKQLSTFRKIDMADIQECLKHQQHRRGPQFSFDYSCSDFLCSLRISDKLQNGSANIR
jgi:hypothetical protein